MKSKAVKGTIAVLGSINETIKSDIVPIIPPIIQKIFLPYFPKKSIVGPYTNFIIQGTDDKPPTSVVISIDMFLSVKNKTKTTVVNAKIKPSAKYKEPNKKYFNEGNLARSIILEIKYL